MAAITTIDERGSWEISTNLAKSFLGRAKSLSESQSRLPEHLPLDRSDGGGAGLSWDVQDMKRWGGARHMDHGVGADGVGA